MPFTIAVTGKGGTGKTTFCAVLIRQLIRRGKGPTLAIDADADGNLVDALGVNGGRTVGVVLDEMEKKINQLPPDISKDAWLQGKLDEIISEEKGFDILSMGRGEGPGCYCYVNTVLRRYMDVLESNYAFLVMDNAAGMEHLSRRTTREAEIMFILSDHSAKGVVSGARIAELARDLKVDVRKMGFIINRVPGRIDPLLLERVKKTGLEILGSLPEDDQVREFDLHGMSFLDLPDDNPLVVAVEDVLQRNS